MALQINEMIEDMIAQISEETEQLESMIEDIAHDCSRVARYMDYIEDRDEFFEYSDKLREALAPYDALTSNLKNTQSYIGRISRALVVFARGQITPEEYYNIYNKS